jgi:hypothetical protein
VHIAALVDSRNLKIIIGLKSGGATLYLLLTEDEIGIASVLCCDFVLVKFIWKLTGLLAILSKSIAIIGYDTAEKSIADCDSDTPA